MNAALGAVSAGGIGSPELDVTQSGARHWLLANLVAMQAESRCRSSRLTQLEGGSGHTKEMAVASRQRRQRYQLRPSHFLQEKLIRLG